MGDRHQRLLGEAGRFMAVGGLATAVAFVLFNGLVHGLGTGWSPLHSLPIVGYVVANVAGMAVSYRGTRHWAFRDRPPHHADGGRTAFLAINVATMALPVGCLAISRDVLGLADPVSDNVSANVVGLGLGQLARFWLYRTVVFKRPIGLGDIYPAPDPEPGTEPPVVGDPDAPAATRGPVSATSTEPPRGDRVPPPVT